MVMLPPGTVLAHLLLRHKCRVILLIGSIFHLSRNSDLVFSGRELWYWLRSLECVVCAFYPSKMFSYSNQRPTIFLLESEPLQASQDGKVCRSHHPFLLPCILIIKAQIHISIAITHTLQNINYLFHIIAHFENWEELLQRMGLWVIKKNIHINNHEIIAYRVRTLMSKTKNNQGLLRGGGGIQRVRPL